MPRSPVWNMRLDPADKERWEGAAAAVRMPLSEFVKTAVEEKIAASPSDAPRPTKASVKKGATVAHVCAKERFHRPGSFCKTCGTSF